MRRGAGWLALGLFAFVGVATDDDGRRWWKGDYKDEYWDGPCEVKVESKRGEWKKEFRDGPCLVKQEAKRDEYEEEVKCDRPG